MSPGDKCPVCGGAIKEDEGACSVCGTVFTPGQSSSTESDSQDDTQPRTGSEPETQGIVCPDCGNMVPEGENVCDECGSRIGIGSKDDYEDIDETDKAVDITIDKEGPDEIDDTPIELDEDFDLDNLDRQMENLLKLPGVGPLRAKILLEAGYDDLRKLKRASVMELVKIKGIGRKSAGEIKAALRDIDLEEIRKKKLDKDQIEAEHTCPLCNTIVSVFETACYECGTALKDHHAQVIEGDPDSMALAYYDTKLKEDPVNSELWYARGATLIKMEEFDKALASFDKALEMDPDFQNVWISKAEVFNKIGEPMKAAECYSHVISASTDADDDYQEIDFPLSGSEPAADIIPSEDTIETSEEPEDQMEIVEEAEEMMIEDEAEEDLSSTEEPGDMDMDDGLGDDLSLDAPAEPEAEVEYEEVEQEELIEETVEVIEEEPAEEMVIEEEVEVPEETIELIEAEPEPEPEPVEDEEVIEKTVVQPAEVVTIMEEEPAKPAEDPNDPKVLKKSLSIHAVAIKPLLILAKELNIDVLAQKKIIAQGVNESKKKNLGGAVALMKQGRRQIEKAFVAKANDDLGAIAGLSRDLKLEGHNVERISDVITLAKDLLEQGQYKECFDKMNVALAMVENIRAEG